MRPFRNLSVFAFTPADATAPVDTDRILVLVARLAAAGAESIRALSSTSSYPHFSTTNWMRSLVAAVYARHGSLWDLFAVQGRIRMTHQAALIADFDAVALPRPCQPLTGPMREDTARALAAACNVPGVPA